jgi:ABC-2 type transport system permease protein
VSGTLTLVWRQYRLERRMFWRNPTAAFFNFLFPLILLALFGAVFANDQKNLNVIVPGIAGMAIMATTFTALAFNMTFLREQGVLKRIRGTPLPSGGSTPKSCTGRRRAGTKAAQTPSWSGYRCRLGI